MPLFSKNIFTRRRFLVWQGFFPLSRTLKIHCSTLFQPSQLWTGSPQSFESVILSVVCHFPLTALKIVFLSLVFSNLTIVCFGVFFFFFVFILFGFHWAFRIYKFMSSMKFEKNLAIISSTFFWPHSLSPFLLEY